MFDNLKFGTVDRIRKAAVGVVIDYLQDGKANMKDTLAKRLAPDNPDIPNDVEIPAEQAAVGAIGWAVDIACAVLKPFA